MQWNYLIQDLKELILSYLTPSERFMLIDKEIYHMGLEWLVRHFKQEFGLTVDITELESGESRLLRFYRENKNNNALQLNTKQDYRYVINRFVRDTSRQTLHMPASSNAYYRFMVYKYCDLLKLGHTTIVEHQTVIKCCVRCGSRAWNRRIVTGYDSDDEMRCDRCDAYNSWWRGILTEKTRTLKIIVITKEASKRELKRRRCAKKESPLAVSLF